MQVKALDVYIWLSHRFTDVFNKAEEAQEAQRSSPVTQPKMDALTTTRHPAISESSS